MEFSRELRNDVLAGDITLSVRLWKRPQVKEGGRYRVGLGLIYSWNAAVDGFSYSYAPAGNGRYRLGTRYLTVYNLATPSPITTACSTNPALMLACWADRRGPGGNTVVPNVDQDGDGYFANWNDSNDNNKYVQ